MHMRTLHNLRRKTSAVQLDRVDADVQQNLRTIGSGQRQCMAGAREMRDHAVARRDELAHQRIYADTVAEHAARKHRVGHVRERYDRTGHGRKQNNMALGWAH